MTWSEAIFLSLVQGITEFLPISSSGHLAFFENLFLGTYHDEKTAILKQISNERFAFNIFIHLGTLFSIIIFYYSQIKALIQGWMKEIKQKKPGVYSRFFLHLTGVTLITGVVGLLLKNITYLFYSNLFYLSLLFFLMAIILYLTKFALNDDQGPKSAKMISNNADLSNENTTENTASTDHHLNRSTMVTRFFKLDRLEMMSLPHKFILIVGIAQGISVLPGISRSGMTLTVALFLGLKHRQLIQYVMLISIPVFLGVFFYELPQIIRISIPQVEIYLFALIFSSVVGLLSLRLFSRLTHNRKIYYFSYYLICFGLVILSIL